MQSFLSRILASGLLGASLALASLSAWAAPAWRLPPDGIKLEGAEKQAYMAGQMDALFRRHNAHAAEVPFEAPDGWGYDSLCLDGLKVERLENTAMPNDVIVLQLHGGGYIGPLHDRYRSLAVKQGVLAKARAVYMVNYRLAPKHTYPAALEDALKVYEYLLRHGARPENIIVFGDSAGGNLALAMALALKERRLPQPRAMVLISPWTTLETNLPSRSANAERDLVLGKTNKAMYDEVSNPSYGGKLPASSPALSPIHADLSGLAPMLVQVGGYEMFLDDGMELLKKAVADGAKITLTVYPVMPHDFALVLPEMQESVDSFKEIRSFLENTR